MKQTIEIEVPDGKKAICENNQIKFVDVESLNVEPLNVEPHWKSIKTFIDAFWYCVNHRNLSKYIYNYDNIVKNTYEKSVSKLRLIIAALTNNEKLSLVEGNLYFPIVQFCSEHNIDRCYGNKIIGKIKTKGKEYVVVGGYALDGSTTGLGYIHSNYDFTYAHSYVSYLQVSSKEIAEHLSTYFGKLIFEVMYGGSNCEWEWVE